MLRFAINAIQKSQRKNSDIFPYLYAWKIRPGIHPQSARSICRRVESTRREKGQPHLTWEYTRTEKILRKSSNNRSFSNPKRDDVYLNKKINELYIFDRNNKYHEQVKN
jgi:hypothetical protein